LTDEYALGKKLGTGSYAVVREATNKMSLQTYAVKIIDRKNAKEQRLRSEVRKRGERGRERERERDTERGVADPPK
jgi:hypothetical protein